MEKHIPSPERGLRIVRKSTALACLLILFILGAISSGMSEERVTKLLKGKGTLTAVEEDGTVIIDGKGYGVARDAVILDWRKRHATLDKLELPAWVSFSYVRSAGERGPMIKRLQEFAR